MEYQNRRQIRLVNEGPVRLDDIPSVPVTVNVQNRGSVALRVTALESDRLLDSEKFSNLGNLNQLQGFATKDLQNPIGVSEPTALIPGFVDSVNAETFNLNAGDTIVASIDGGSNDTATFDAAVPTPLVGSNTETFDFSTSDRVLTIDVNGEQEVLTLVPADFSSPNAGTAVEAAAALNDRATLAITFDVSGTSVRINHDKAGSGQSFQVIESGADQVEDVLGFALTANTGTGDVADIEAVTGAEIKTVVEADISNSEVTVLPSGAVRLASTTLGAASSIKISADSTGIGEDKVDLEVGILFEGSDDSASEFLPLAGPVIVQPNGSQILTIISSAAFLQFEWDDGSGNAVVADATLLLNWIGTGGYDRSQPVSLSDDPNVSQIPVY